MAYLLDANVFIQAKNLHYGFDFCPAFWAWLEQANSAGIVFSIEQVGKELEAGVDTLSDWASNRGPQFFLPATAAILASLPQISQWVNGQQYEPVAINTFFQVADYWLVGHALAHGHTVVTHEVPSVSAKKVKIPNVCVGLAVSCVTPFQMLRQEHAQFILGP